MDGWGRVMAMGIRAGLRWMGIALAGLAWVGQAAGFQAVPFPDFTRGQWMYRKNEFALGDDY